MPLPVKLKDVVGELSGTPEGWQAYINRRTGEIVMIPEDEFAADLWRGDDDFVPDWQKDMLADVEDVEGSEDFVPLPDRFEIHEYSIVEDFCHSLDDGRLRDGLLRAIQGKGAFGWFKNMIRRRGIEEDWWSYRDAAIGRIAAAFLEEVGIPFER
jgi:hypothetical protein